MKLGIIEDQLTVIDFTFTQKMLLQNLKNSNISKISSKDIPMEYLLRNMEKYMSYQYQLLEVLGRNCN
jgi:hypothetical protein